MSEYLRPIGDELYIRPVDTQTVWINPDKDVRQWIQHAFGIEEELRQFLSVNASTTLTERRGWHLPSGGRTVIMPLPLPFYDSLTYSLCIEADVKGCLLTPHGYQIFQDELEGDQYREVMENQRLGYLFGPENLEDALQQKEDLRLIRQRNVAAPVPLAVLKLNEITINGETIGVTDFLKQRGEVKEYPGGFAMLCRLWPKSAVRVEDYMQFPYTLRHARLPWEVGYRYFDNTQTTEILRRMRRLWYDNEMKRLTDRKSPEAVFQQYLEDITSGAIQILKTGLTPISLYAADDLRSHHAHIHNVTTRPVFVEWTPMVTLSELKSNDRILHLETVMQYMFHEAVVAVGLLCLDDYSLIPTFPQFLARFSDSGVDDQISIVRQCHPRSGYADSFLGWAKDHQDDITGHK